MPKTIQEAIHRGNNLLMVVILAVLSVGAVILSITENELLDKADDLIFVVLGVIAVVWYLRGRHRYQFSWAPLVLVALALLSKVFAFIAEFRDPATVGDDYGYLAIMVLVAIIGAFLLVRARRMEILGNAGMLPGASIPQTGHSEDEGL